jgi:hypothetical protein
VSTLTVDTDVSVNLVSRQMLRENVKMFPSMVDGVSGLPLVDVLHLAVEE